MLRLRAIVLFVFFQMFENIWESGGISGRLASLSSLSNETDTLSCAHLQKVSEYNFHIRFVKLSIEIRYLWSLNDYDPTLMTIIPSSYRNNILFACNQKVDVPKNVEKFMID